MAKTIITSKDDKVVWGTMIAIIVVVIGWTCVLVYGIKKDVSQIKNTVLNIQETLKPIERRTIMDRSDYHSKIIMPFLRDYYIWNKPLCGRFF